MKKCKDSVRFLDGPMQLRGAATLSCSGLYGQPSSHRLAPGTAARREGPMVHISAAVGEPMSSLCQLLSTY